jgi:hypothetical protein
MKYFTIQLTALVALLLAGGCSEESHPVASEQLGIIEMFSPGADADPEVWRMFNDYGVWVRTHFASVQELTNSILEVDNLVRVRGAENLDSARYGEVYLYTSTLLANLSPEFTRAFFPLEFYYVKSYGVSYWVYPLKRLGRGRLIISWPNTTAGTIPVTDPANHYYQDSVLTTGVWGLITPAITARMEEPPAGFVAAGKPHDNGEVYDQILDAYYADGDLEKYDTALDELTRDGGYVTGSGSRDFRADLADWIRLIATESRENIQRDYLSDSKARAAKYEIVINFMKQYKWDIQAAGNTFRQRHDAYKSSL